MRILVQVVKNAKVDVDGKTVGKIDKGELIFVGFKPGDSTKIVDKMIQKLLKLRIFFDGEKTNASLDQVNGKILSVSQFTLYANLKEGNRPSFSSCMNKDDAGKLYEYFQNELLKFRPDTEFGFFHADMKVSLLNDGPFTILLDSEELGYE